MHTTLLAPIEPAGFLGSHTTKPALSEPLSEPIVVLIDDKSLRRTVVECFLGPWIQGRSAHLMVASTAEQLPCGTLSSSTMIVWNVGSLRCSDPAMRQDTEALVRLAEGTPVALLSDSTDRTDVVAAFECGVHGYLPSSTTPQVALEALAFVMAGGQYFPPEALLGGTATAGAEPPRPNDGRKRAEGLTIRQLEVLRLLRKGKPNKVIARELNLQEATVKVHVRQIMRRLGVSNRTQAALVNLPDLEALNARSSGSAAACGEGRG